MRAMFQVMLILLLTASIIDSTKGYSRMIRGGGWPEVGVNCRAAHRVILDRDVPIGRVGFRVVLASALVGRVAQYQEPPPFLIRP